MVGICDRADCFAFCKSRENNCNALSMCYEDNEQCLFYKKAGTEMDSLYEAMSLKRQRQEEDNE